MTLLEHPSDLRGDDVLAARPIGEALAQTSLRQPQAVVRGGVEIADAALPGGLDRFIRLDLRGLAEEIAELSRSQADLGER